MRDRSAPWLTGLLGFLCLLSFLASAGCRPSAELRAGRVELRRDDAAGLLTVAIDGLEALTYRYGPDLDLPHYWPLNSPSGRNMLIQHPHPYPHHRAFWFADTVRPAGAARDVSTYMAYVTGRKTGEEAGEGVYEAPFRDRIRHDRFVRLEASGDSAVVEAVLAWEMDGGTPVLEETRRLVVTALGDGEYLLDLEFTLAPARGAVEFVSDEVHYAWPYLRLDPLFSGTNGGRIVSDAGGAGEAGTNLQFANWIDYSSAPDGVAEGIAIFQYADGEEHRWLTREYGTFGPRRPDAMSGKPFVLRPGDTLRQRVGILVHRGDVESGRVAERYREYTGASGE